MNPSAGGGRALSRWRRMETELRHAKGGFEQRFTEGPGHGTEVAREAVRAGVTRVAVVGGDGTMHEVVQALAGTNVAVAFLGGGSSCDFGKDLPRRTPLARLANANCIPRDVLRIECAGSAEREPVVRLAGNGSHIGLVAEAAWRMNTCRWRAKWVDGAAVACAYSAYRCWRPADFTLQYEEGPVMDRLLNLSVMKRNWLCGRMRLDLSADESDGHFHVLEARPAALSGLLLALYRGRVSGHPAIRVRRAQSMDVRGPAGLLVEADGEIIGRTPARYSIWRKALRVLV